MTGEEGPPEAVPGGGLPSPGRGVRSTRFPSPLPPLDRLLAGGLRRDALHEVRSDTARDAAAATGFAAALLARLAARDRRPVLWVAEAAALREAGLPYGAGLDCFGTDSSRLILVRVRKPAEALWVFEEGLACRGLAAVLAEIRGNPRPLDLTATRRLALRAEAGGVMGLLLRQSGEPDADSGRDPLVRGAAAGGGDRRLPGRHRPARLAADPGAQPPWADRRSRCGVGP